jgi:hypothetical protein
MRETDKGSILHQRWINIVSISLILILLFLYVVFVKERLVSTFDDAYMYSRYANNYSAGYGISWNRDGIQTYGTTSILYLMIIVFLQRVVVSSIDGSTILTVTSASLAIFAIAVLAITCAKHATTKKLKNHFLPIAVILSALFLLSQTFLFHAISGTDTTLSFLCNSILILATLQWVYREKKYTFLFVIIASYFSYLARPDNLIYAIVFPISCCILLASANQKRKMVIFLFGICICLAFDTIVKYIIFGDPIPLPFYAKLNGYYDGYLAASSWNPIYSLFEFGMVILPFLMVSIALFITKDSLKLLLAFLIPVTITFTYYFSVLQIMGLHARYYFPAAPYFVVTSFLILDRFLQREKSNTVKVGRLVVEVFVAIVFLIPFFRSYLGNLYEDYFIPVPHIYSSSVKYITSSRQPLPQLGWWESIQAVSEIAIKLPNGTKFSLSEYGYIGAKAPNIIIVDPLGLNDPFFAHNGFSVDEFFKRKPDIIWLPHPDYTKIVSSILDSSEFWEEYDYYPGAFDYGLAIRKDSSNFQEIYKDVSESWQNAYGYSSVMNLYIAHLILSK